MPFPHYDEGDIAMLALEDEIDERVRTKWDRVLKALSVAYERYHNHNDQQGFWRAIRRLMQAYDSWLD
jgi:hypothetical protein